MMRGLIVFITAMLSIIFLKRRLHRHHWSALFLIIAGIAVVGIAALSSDESSSSNPEVGIILLVASQFAAGAMFIVEEKLLGNYYLNPLKVVGWEGIWGVSIYTVLLFIFQFITNCPETFCPKERNFHFEDSIMAFKQMADTPILIVYSIGVILSIAFFNALGLAVTKFASAAQRSTIDTSRTVLIWAICLIIT